MTSIMNQHNNSAETPYHIPALLPEVVEGLDIHPGGIYVDATFGGGGHSRGILERLDAGGRLLGFDQDPDAADNAIDDTRFTFVRSNFQYIPNFLRFYGLGKADGILADLGVSFHHFDDAARGFSFRVDAPLDMRMNTAGGETAADLLNDSDEETLATILRVGSDLGNSRQIAKAIVKARTRRRIATTGELTEAVGPLLNPRSEKKDLAQVFQALRIAVNHEIDALETFLKNAAYSLKPGGRLAVITYHSLEDRLVKSMMKAGNLTGEVEKDFFGNVTSPWRLITRSPITPSAEEVERNPRSRSAKLRIAELR